MIRKVFSVVILTFMLLGLTFLSLGFVGDLQNVVCYRQQGGAKEVAESGCEYEFQSGSTIDVQSGTNFNLDGKQDVTSGGEIEISTGATLDVQDGLDFTSADLTLTDGGTLTPTSVYQVITATAAVTPGAFAAGNDGQFLILRNESANNIVISGTSTIDPGGSNITLGQTDIIGFVYDAGETVWYRVFNVDN